MKSKKTLRQSFGFSAYRKYFSILLLSSLGLIANSQDTTLTVISNIKGAPGNMNMAELRSVLKGEKQRWSDDTKVTIAIMKTNTLIGKNACSKIYGMSGDKVLRLYLELSFVGRTVAILFNSVQELESFVAENPGAIGITGKFSETPNIKITMITGKKSF